MARLIGKDEGSKKIYLPSSAKLPKQEQAWVEVYDTLNATDIFSVDYNNLSGDQMLSLVLKIVKDWNLEDKDGHKLPVNIKNLGLFRAEDIMPLANHATTSVQRQQEEIKKN